MKNYSTNCLIIGDSFATDDAPESWCNNLPFLVHNISARGISEYRIYQKVKQSNLIGIDHVIICHTSSNRIYIENNPYYKQSKTHSHCDLLYNDIKSRLPDEFAKNVTWWYENIFDLSNANFVHELIIEKIQSIIEIPCLHLSFFDCDLKNVLNLHSIWQKHPGTINHLSCYGNQLVRQAVMDHINEK
jgi:hypothetical protein